ncbi:hypothetical protein GCM10028800_13430 [Nesterenkonia populi]
MITAEVMKTGQWTWEAAGSAGFASDVSVSAGADAMKLFLSVVYLIGVHSSPPQGECTAVPVISAIEVRIRLEQF